jgi:transposase InsO family protein
LISQINPPSTKGHKFVLLATDYFTKCVEAIPLKKVTLANMVEFVKEHIIYRFGIPQTITTDQGTRFTSSEFRGFAKSMGIKILNSSPYYAQANGQAEASNKIMIKIIKKKMIRSQKGGIRYSMKPRGLTEWPLMELQKHLLVSWFIGIMLFCHGKCNHTQGE